MALGDGVGFAREKEHEPLQEFPFCSTDHLLTIFTVSLVHVEMFLPQDLGYGAVHPVRKYLVIEVFNLFGRDMVGIHLST